MTGQSEEATVRDRVEQRPAFSLDKVRETTARELIIRFVSGAATSYPMTSLPRRAVRDLRLLATSPLAIALGVLFIGGAVSTLAFFPREGGSSAP